MQLPASLNRARGRADLNALLPGNGGVPVSGTGARGAFPFRLPSPFAARADAGLTPQAVRLSATRCDGYSSGSKSVCYAVVERIMAQVGRAVKIRRHSIGAVERQSADSDFVPRLYVPTIRR